MLVGNALVGQSGGPTSVINASLAGVVETALKCKTIRRVLGMRFGIEGVLGNVLLDLGAEPADTWKGLRTTPSSALPSTPSMPNLMPNTRRIALLLSAASTTPASDALMTDVGPPD